MEKEFLSFLNKDPGNWTHCLQYFKSISPDKTQRALKIKLLLDDLLAKGFIQFPNPNEPYAELKDMTLEEYEAKHHGLDALITLGGRTFLKELIKLENSIKPSFKQKFWWLWPVIAFVAGFFGDIGKEAVKKKMWPEEKVRQLTPEEKIDSVEKLKSKGPPQD